MQILRRRHTDTAVPEEERRHVPAAADVGVRDDLGRVVLGHRQRQAQGGLPPPAVRRQVHQVRRARLLRVRAAAVPPGAVLAVRIRAQQAAARRHGLGAEELHGVRLLQG